LKKNVTWIDSPIFTFIFLNDKMEKGGYILICSTNIFLNFWFKTHIFLFLNYFTNHIFAYDFSC